MPAADKKLRNELDIAAKLGTVGEYRDRIEQLRSQRDHRITVLHEPLLGSPTCYAYALGLGESLEYRQLVKARGQGKAPIHRAVVRSLIRRGELRRRVGPTQPGDVILYYQGRRLRHAGICLGPSEMIRSKWGAHEVHQHQIWEVPAAYGGHVKIYVAPASGRLLALIQAEGFKIRW